MMIQWRLEGVCLGTLQGELGLKSSTQCTCSARALQGLPLIVLFFSVKGANVIVTDDPIYWIVGFLHLRLYHGAAVLQGLCLHLLPTARAGGGGALAAEHSTLLLSACVVVRYFT